MSEKKEIILAFDAYGTLLSTSSIADQLAEHFGSEKAATIAQEWRRYQLEYTWRLNSMNKYTPFSTVTLHSLTHALSTQSLTLPQSTKSHLLSSYNTLTLFPDALPLLSTHLPSSSPRITPYIFTNGTPAMLSSTLTHSQLSTYSHLFKKVVSVDDVKRYKPAPEVYRYLLEEVGKAGEGEERDVWLVSGNPFDVVGAKNVGMRVVWVDREERGWVDCLGEGLEEGEGKEGMGPDVVVRGLDEVVGKVVEYVNNNSTS